MTATSRDESTPTSGALGEGGFAGIVPTAAVHAREVSVASRLCWRSTSTSSRMLSDMNAPTMPSSTPSSPGGVLDVSAAASPTAALERAGVTESGLGCKYINQRSVAVRDGLFGTPCSARATGMLSTTPPSSRRIVCSGSDGNSNTPGMAPGSNSTGSNAVGKDAVVRAAFASCRLVPGPTRSDTAGSAA